MANTKTHTKRYNTNLASEFYVLSMLHRVGANAYLSLGNKKSVDILVEKDGGALTIDVKGVAAKDNFPVSLPLNTAPNHYYVFVSFLGAIADEQTPPRVFIVPAPALEQSHRELDGKDMVSRYTDRADVLYSTLEKLSARFDTPAKWDVFAAGEAAA